MAFDTVDKAREYDLADRYINNVSVIAAITNSDLDKANEIL